MDDRLASDHRNRGRDAVADDARQDPSNDMVEKALDVADHLAVSSQIRLSHDEVFGTIRREFASR